MDYTNLYTYEEIHELHPVALYGRTLEEIHADDFEFLNGAVAKRKTGNNFDTVWLDDEAANLYGLRFISYCTRFGDVLVVLDDEWNIAEKYPTWGDVVEANAKRFTPGEINGLLEYVYGAMVNHNIIVTPVEVNIAESQRKARANNLGRH